MAVSDEAVFERDGSLIRQKGNYNDDFILGRDALPANGDFTDNTLFFFDKDRYAFRTGWILGFNWAPDSIGLGSFAFG